MKTFLRMEMQIDRSLIDTYNVKSIHGAARSTETKKRTEHFNRQKMEIHDKRKTAQNFSQFVGKTIFLALKIGAVIV